MQNMLQYYIVNREKKTSMSRNACSNENGRFDSILSNQMNVHGFDDFGKF